MHTFEGGRFHHTALSYALHKSDFMRAGGWHASLMALLRVYTMFKTVADEV